MNEMSKNDITSREKGIRIFFVPIIWISLLTALDQLTKYIVVSNLKLYESWPIIKGVFNFTYIQNKGMAWGMFQGKIPVFAIFTALIIIFAFRFMYNVVDNKRYRWAKYVLILLISGGVGNLIDRMTLGYVVDFFDFELIDFPIFNVADIFVVVSMISAMILLFFVYKNEEIDEILRIFDRKKSIKIDKEEESEEVVAEEDIDAEEQKKVDNIEASDDNATEASLDDEE